MDQNVSPNPKGEFSLKRVTGTYRINMWLPSDDWYVANMTIPSPSKLIDISTAGLSVKSGQRVSNLNIVLKNGAASLSGKVLPKSNEGSAPDLLHVYLIPSEVNRVDEGLRFADIMVQADGTFILKNLAPGSYKILARPADKETKANTNRSDDSSLINTHDGRVLLMREANESTVIELRSCEKQTGYKLKY